VSVVTVLNVFVNTVKHISASNCKGTKMLRRFVSEYYLVLLLSLCVAVACCKSLIASQEIDGESSIGVSLEEIAEVISDQRRCWKGLMVKYRCNEISLPKDDQWYRESLVTWISDRGGRERIRVELIGASSDILVKLPWVQEAAFNGEYSTSWDSQSQGSGEVSSQVNPFMLELRPPRQFFTICGASIGIPVEVDEYLISHRSLIERVVKNAESIEFIGRMCHTDEDRIRFRLDPLQGYQMVFLEKFDKRGLLSIYEIGELRKFVSKNGEFWFPSRATWTGVDPGTRGPDYRMDCQLEQLLVDQELDDDAFAISYPPGTLLLNSDTGEGFYIERQTDVSDVPDFIGKKVSVAEYFERSSGSNLEPKRRYFLITILVMILPVLYFATRNLRTSG
jgi:hypothetical protein